MNDQVQNVFAQLAQQLGVSVEQLWPVYVEYTRAVHLTNMLTSLVLSVACVVFGYVSFRVTRSAWEKDSDRGKFSGSADMLFYQWFFGAIAFVASVMFFLITVNSAIRELPAVIIPQGQAILDLLSQFKKT